MVTDLTHPENFEAQVPKSLQATLRHYQETGYKWLKMLSHYQFGGILADEMGLGRHCKPLPIYFRKRRRALERDSFDCRTCKFNL